jgi:hypothetical protein
MVLKAKRNYKETVAKKATQAEKKMVEAFEKDMATAKENKYFKEQVAEFGTFLTEATKKDKPFQFLVDMKAKLDEGVILTDNMANAIRKCMKREQEWQNKQKASEAGDYPSITLKLKPFYMKNLGLDSRIVTGKVKAETAKAWLIEGHADMLESMSWCVRCGRQLHEPASQVTGMGVICAEKAGIPYDQQDVLSMSAKKRKEIKKQFVKKLHAQKFEAWVPKSQAEVYEG